MVAEFGDITIGHVAACPDSKRVLRQSLVVSGQAGLVVAACALTIERAWLMRLIDVAAVSGVAPEVIERWLPTQLSSCFAPSGNQ